MPLVIERIFLPVEIIVGKPNKKRLQYVYMWLTSGVLHSDLYLRPPPHTHTNLNLILPKPHFLIGFSPQSIPKIHLICIHKSSKHFPILPILNEAEDQRTGDSDPQIQPALVWNISKVLQLIIK